MKNPWTAKNPWMSAWLSGANTIMNTARGHATHEAHRRLQSAMTQQAKQAADFWASVWTGSAATIAPAKRTRRKKR